MKYKLSDIVDSRWYLDNYEDVKNSKLKAKYHYDKYGKKEGRIPNPYVTIDSKFFRCIFIFFNILKINTFKLNYFNHKFYTKTLNFLIFVFLSCEYKFLRKLKSKKGKIYITSWVDGGVSNVIQFYITKDLILYDYIIVIKSIKNLSSQNFPCFKIEFYSKDSHNYEKIICPFPSFFIGYILQNHLTIQQIDIHHTFGFEKMIDILLNKLNLPLFYFFHDYYLLSSNWSFYDISIEYSSTKTNFLDNLTNNNWPLESRKRLIERLDFIITTSFFSYRLLLNDINFEAKKIIMQYVPEESNLELIPVYPKLITEDKINILILGNIGIYKGLNILNKMSEIVSEKSEKFNFHHIGNVSEGVLNNKIISYGWLEESVRKQKIFNLNANLAILPAQSPETYSLVLSELIRLQIPIIASAVGAITERIFDRQFCFLIEDFSNADLWANIILQFQNLTSIEKTNFNLIYELDIDLIKNKRLRL